MLAGDLALLPQVSILASDNRSAETNDGETLNTGTFLISRTGPTDASLTVRLSYGGSASFGSDYRSVSSVVTIPAGASSAEVGITAINDTIPEAQETVYAFIQSPNQTSATYTLGTSSAVVTIDDNDVDASTSVVSLMTVDFQAVETVTGQTANRGEIRLMRTGPWTNALTVNVKATGSATPDSDYTAIPATATFPAGSPTASVFVTPIDDTIAEWPEYVQLQLTPSTVSGSTLPFYVVDSGRQYGSVTIEDNDVPRVGVVATDSRARETAAGVTPDTGTFTVTRTGATDAPLTVGYRISGTATSGSDYVTLPGSVTFGIGESSAVIMVTPVDDSTMETSEHVSISLIAPTVTSTGSPTFAVDGARSGASVTIEDDDIQSLPKVSVVATDSTASETVAGQTANGGMFVISRTGATDSPMTVNYRAHGSATSGVDYDALPGSAGSGTSVTGSITIPAGESSVSLAVNPIDDSVVEWSENVQISLSAPSNVVNGQLVVPSYLLDTTKSFASVNVADNDQPLISLVAVDNKAAETALGNTPNPGAFVISRTGATDVPLTVSYRVFGNATSGVDYETLPGVTASTTTSGTTSIVTLTGTVTIPAGAATVATPVNVIDDSVFEYSESVSVYLLGPTSVANQPPQYVVDYSKYFGTVTIDDNDQSQQPKVSIVATDNRAAETTSGQPANTGTYVITRTGPTTGPLTVNYRASGNAVSGIDFEALPGSTVSTVTSGTYSYTSIVGSVTIPAGESTVAITLTAIDDSIYELSESLSISLASPPSTFVNGQSLPPAYAVDNSKSYAFVTIDDNDQSTLPRISVVATDNRAAETGAGEVANTGTFVISRTGAVDADLVVGYRLFGNAVNGSDYETLSGSVTIPAGQSSVSITVNAIDDTAVEWPESAILSLASSPTVNSIPRYTIDTTKSNASVTIDDNDFQNLPRISVVATDKRAAETKSGATPNGGLFVFSRTGTTDAALTVAYRVYGNATAGVDYQALPGNVTFAAGESTAAVSLDVIDDSTIELSEYAALNIVNSATAAGSIPTYQFNFATSYASVTIADDDAPIVSLAVSDSRAAETAVGQTANPAQFVISRQGATDAPLTITYRVFGSAISGVDYDALPGVTASTTTNGTTSVTTLTGTVTIPAGSSTVALDINAIDDSVYEYTESVSVSLSLPAVAPGTPAPYAIDYSKSFGYVYIDDNDQALQPKVSVVATDASAAETTVDQPANNGVFTVSRTGATDRDLTVYYRVEGTATSGVDYTSLSGSVVIPAGQASATVTVAAIDDASVESTETVRLVLVAAPPQAGLPPIYQIDSTKSAATVSIADNDTTGGTTTASPSSLGGTSSDRAKVTDAVFQMLSQGMLG